MFFGEDGVRFLGWIQLSSRQVPVEENNYQTCSQDPKIYVEGPETCYEFQHGSRSAAVLNLPAVAVAISPPSLLFSNAGLGCSQSSVDKELLGRRVLKRGSYWKWGHRREGQQ